VTVIVAVIGVLEMVSGALSLQAVECLWKLKLEMVVQILEQ
jgi:hypothetical protein